MKQYRKFQLLLIVLFAGIPYFCTLNGEFVFDDTEAIVKNNDVTSNSWTDPFYHDFWGTRINSLSSHKSYRPLTIISFKLNYLLNGKQYSAFQFKITNTVLHIFCCGLVWNSYKTILNRINFKCKRCFFNIEFTAILLFSTHPIHVESVSGVVGRADILAAIMFFIAFLVYDKAMNSTSFSLGYLFLTILSAGIAMLFKENGITVLGFCTVYDLIMNLKIFKSNKIEVNANYFDKKFIKPIARLLCLLISIIILLCIRWLIMGGSKPEFKSTDNPAAFAKSAFTRIASHTYVYFINGLLLIWPNWLCYDWSMGCIPLINKYSDCRIICIILLYVFASMTILYIFKSRTKVQSVSIIVISSSLLIIPFLPASNIFYPVGFVVAERILYIPSAGYCLFIAVGLHKILQRLKSAISKKIVKSTFYSLILVYALRSAQRGFEWQSEYKLFTSGLSVCPLNAKVHYNIAKVADAKNNISWAMTEYKEAIRLYPDYYQAMNNFANLLKNQREFKEAEFFLRKAISIKEDFPAAWMNLGIVLASTTNYVESERAYNNALKYRKHYPDCHYNLGNLYLELNKTDTAMAHWLHAIQLNAKHNSAWTNLLAVLDNTGEIEKALQIIPEALKELPDSPTVIFSVANIYGKIDEYEEAEKYFLRAIELLQDHVKPIHFANLGVLYHRWKKYDMAEKMYRKALEIQPSFKSAQTNLDNLRRFKMKIINKS